MSQTSKTLEHDAYSAACILWIPGIAERVASYLPGSFVATSLRLVDRTTSSVFSYYKSVRLSFPVPEGTFAARWAKPGALRSLSFKHRRQLLILTAASGVLANLKVALKATAASLTEAASLQDPDTALPGQYLPWLEELGCWWLKEVFAAAAGAGHQPVCEWLLAAGCPCDAKALTAALRGGFPGLTDWLLAQRPDLRPAVKPTELLAAAAEGCDLPSLQRLFRDWAPKDLLAAAEPPPDQDLDYDAFLVQKRRRSLQERIITAAAASPTPDWRAKVDWLEAQMAFLLNADDAASALQVTQGAIAAAATAAAASCGGTHLLDVTHRLAWVREQGCPLGKPALVGAARVGNTATLSYLLGVEGGLSPGGDQVDEAVTAAAAGGHLAFLQELHARRLLVSSWGACVPAAESGRLEVVAWLAEVFRLSAFDLQGLMKYAVRSGSVALVQWLVGRGCWLGAAELVCDAVAGGCEELLEWLVAARGCHLQGHEKLYHAAAFKADIMTLRCLHRLGFPMKAEDKAYDGGARSGHLSVLRFLRTQMDYPFKPGSQVPYSCTAAVESWWAQELGAKEG